MYFDRLVLLNIEFKKDSMANDSVIFFHLLSIRFKSFYYYVAFMMKRAAEFVSRPHQSKSILTQTHSLFQIGHISLAFDLIYSICEIRLCWLWWSPCASLRFLGVIFKAHPMVQNKINVLNKLIEQFAKIWNKVSGQNVEILHIKVPQRWFQVLR